MNGFDVFMRGLLGTGQPEMPFGSMFPNQMAAAANEQGTAGFVGTDAYGQPLRAAIQTQPQHPAHQNGQNGGPGGFAFNNVGFNNSLSQAANAQGTAGPVGTAGYQAPLHAAFQMGPPMKGSYAGPETARQGPQEKSPLQRIGEILMRTPNAPTVAPHPFGAGNGQTLSQYLQSRPWLARGTGGLY